MPHYDKLIKTISSQRVESRFDEKAGVVATHYNNPDDDRKITGVQDDAVVSKLYKEAKADDTNDDKNKRLFEMNEEDITVEKDKEPDSIIERVFGMKVALGIISVNWKFREEALKFIIKQAPTKINNDMDFMDTIKACSAA